MSETLEARTGSHTNKRGLKRLAVTAATAAALLIPTCSGDDDSSSDDSAPGTETATTLMPVLPERVVSLVFDDRQNGPEEITVYHGPGSSEADRQPVGIEWGSRTTPGSLPKLVLPTCVEPDGRDIPINQSLNESTLPNGSVSSNDWAGYFRPDGQEAFAPLAYSSLHYDGQVVTVSEVLQQQLLPDCSGGHVPR